MCQYKNAGVKRILNLFVPVSACNLQCSYCYVSQCAGRRKDEMPIFQFEPKHIGQALSIERLGGRCFVNICGDGETLLPSKVVLIIHEILKQGHFVECVTNGTLSNRFDEILCFEPELLKHLEFKFSFHFEELMKKNLLKNFVENVNKIKGTNTCSLSIEMTTCDALIDKIPEIVDFCEKNFGAKCHLTIARDDKTKKMNMLTDLDRKEYRKIWSAFDSNMFTFKNEIYGNKRKEYCYAGDWMLMINLATGETSQCYKGYLTQNIFKNIDEKIDFAAVGRHCRMAHCYNGHAMLTFGMIPELNKTPCFSEMRNRICKDGSEWLTPELKSFFSTKLLDNNNPYTIREKIWNEFKLFNGGMKILAKKYNIL